MTQRKLVIAAALCALAATAATPAQLSADGPERCVFETYSPGAVAPYEVEENVGYGSARVLRGAQLYVPAREGLTKEWLEVSVRQAFSAARAGEAARCRPQVRDVDISVTSAGTGFWVRLGSKKTETARALLLWARTNTAPVKAAQ